MDLYDEGPVAAGFVTATDGWALVPGRCRSCLRVLHTVDAGRHWALLGHPRLPLRPWNVYQGSLDLAFVDHRDGYVVADGSCGDTCVTVSRDGGRTWHRRHLAPVRQLVTTGRYAYLLTGGRHRRPELWRSERGGRLTRVHLPLGRPRSSRRDVDLAAFHQSLALTRGTFLPGGPSGGLWTSPDGGARWTRRPVPCRRPIDSAAAVTVALNNPDALLLDCFNELQSQQATFTRHHLFASGDDGRTWTRRPDPSDAGYPVLLADNGAGHAFLATVGGADALDETLDGGTHWRQGVLGHGGFEGWADLRFLTADTGFVLGPTQDQPSRLDRTLDGGRTWQRLPTPGSPCRADQLSVRSLGVLGYAGHSIQTLAVTNVSSRTCSVQGFAAVRSATSSPVRIVRRHRSAGWTRVGSPRIMLAPDRSAGFWLGRLRRPGRTCDPVGVRVAVRLRPHGPALTGQPRVPECRGQHLAESPFRADATPPG